MNTTENTLNLTAVDTSSECTYVMFEVYIIDMISQESVF